MRKPITLEDFLLPFTKEEDELQSSNCNQISRVGPPLPLDSEDSEDENLVPPTMPPLMDDNDFQDSDRESDPDEEDYLSNEI